MDTQERTFAIATLGCKVNQYDGQAIRERLVALGWREVAFRESASLYVVNTCTVTAAADEKCRKKVRRALRRNPNARLVVTGCAARADPERFRRIRGVSAVLTREQMGRMDRFLESGATPEPGGAFDLGISRFAGHTRAFLKIQDGCEAGCAYCIVPRARGPIRSRPLGDVRAEAERLVASGHVEIVLTGIHLGHYGYDLGARPRLCDAVREVLRVPELERLRLSSIEATELNDELLDLVASDARLCPHFHLPLQSGDDAVLAAMGRGYTVSEFQKKLERAGDGLGRPSFTTDVMVGFPGETDAQFQNTLEACRRARFSRIHIFPFSPRLGTPAYHLPGRVPKPVIREREAALKKLASELALEYKKPFIGEVVHPLVENRRDRGTGLLTGWTARYLRATFDGPDSLMGGIVPVVVKEVSPEQLRCMGASA